MNKFSELADNNDIAKEDNFIFNLESADLPSDTTITDQDSDSLYLSATEGRNFNINVGLPIDNNDNDNEAEGKKGVPSEDKVMCLMHRHGLDKQIQNLKGWPSIRRGVIY